MVPTYPHYDDHYYYDDRDHPIHLHYDDHDHDYHPIHPTTNPHRLTSIRLSFHDIPVVEYIIPYPGGVLVPPPAHIALLLLLIVDC